MDDNEQYKQGFLDALTLTSNILYEMSNLMIGVESTAKIKMLVSATIDRFSKLVDDYIEERSK